MSVESWFKLYVQKISYRDVSRYFAKNYPINDKNKEALSKLQKETYELRKCAKYEELEDGLSEIF
jgi:hypothetical protein